MDPLYASFISENKRRQVWRVDRPRGKGVPAISPWSEQPHPRPVPLQPGGEEDAIRVVALLEARRQELASGLPPLPPPRIPGVTEPIRKPTAPAVQSEEEGEVSGGLVSESKAVEDSGSRQSGQGRDLQATARTTESLD